MIDLSFTPSIKQSTQISAPSFLSKIVIYNVASAAQNLVTAIKASSSGLAQGLSRRLK